MNSFFRPLRARLKDIIPFLPILALPFILFASAGPGTPPGPSIFFSDITSGPNTGGQNSEGAFVTIYGKGFGASQGSSTVTVGCEPVANYPVWTDTKIAFQLGSQAKTGNIIVHIPGEALSNAIPFTVRPGNIYFVATDGSDSSNGSFQNPWATVKLAKQVMKAGDTTYVMNGVDETSEDPANHQSIVFIAPPVGGNSQSGTAGDEIALLGYPGATATLGCTTPGGGCPGYALRLADVSYWTVGELNLASAGGGFTLELGGASYIRAVGNRAQCPTANCIWSANFHSSLSTHVQFLGNLSFNGGNTAFPAKYFAGIYLTTDTNFAEVGWNEVDGSGGSTGRGIEVHSSPTTATNGLDQHDIYIHDNYVHDIRGDGIIVATVDPTQGPVEVYNNLVVRAGLPDPNTSELEALHCIEVPLSTEHGTPSPGGTVQIFNNTFYDCGSAGGNLAGAIDVAANPTAPTTVNFVDNLIRLVGNEVYVSHDYDLYNCGSNCTGSNNLLFGGQDGVPPHFVNTIAQNPDPFFVNPANRDFELLSGSPAIDAGIPTAATTDNDGVYRPQGKAYDIGAYEFPQAGQKPAAPAKLSAVTQ